VGVRPNKRVALARGEGELMNEPAPVPSPIARVLVGAFYLYVVAVIVALAAVIVFASRSAFVGVYLVMLGMPWSLAMVLLLDQLGMADALGGWVLITAVVQTVVLNGAILYWTARLALGRDVASRSGSKKE
jgi:hypothetical protein